MINPTFKIVSHPDFECISPKAIVTYEAQPDKKLSDNELAAIKFEWSCFNDPSTLTWLTPKIFNGPDTRLWENAQWDNPGKHTILCDITYADGKKLQLHHKQWVDTASNILRREFDADANNNQAGPFQVLKNREVYNQTLLNIAKKSPPPANKQEAHDKLVEKNREYIGHLKYNLEGLEGLPGIAVDAWHMDRTRSARTTLSLWLVKIPNKIRSTWRLVDWTNPAYKYTTGVYDASGDTDEQAIRHVISKWDSENRYPDGIIRYEFDILSIKHKIEGEFESDGQSSWDEVSTWLDYVALGGAVVAGVATLIAPVPGSRVVSAAIWTSIFTSTAAATINIAQRHDEGFGNWKDDAFDGLSIIGNIFAAGTAWKIGTKITSASKLGANMNKAFLIGQVSTDGLQGILLGTQHMGAYNNIMQDPSLSPDERLKKLMELFRSAALAGTLTYISIKGATGDINNLNNNKTLLSKADIENPQIVVDLEKKVSSVPIGENQKKVNVTVEMEPKQKTVGFYAGRKRVEGEDFFKEVEIVDSNGKPVGEFDEIDLNERVFYEDKSAKGLDRVNPRTGLPAQTAQQFTDKQLLQKTRNRINNLQNSTADTRATSAGTQNVPSLEQIKDIKHFVFRLEGDTPALREAVKNSLETLRLEFPNYKFDVIFGGKQ
ncbi:MAG: hypothetical protein ACKE51_06470 [Methylococcaceae bacterium]